MRRLKFSVPWVSFSALPHSCPLSISREPDKKIALFDGDRSSLSPKSSFADFLPKAAVTADTGFEHIDKPERRALGLGDSDLTRKKTTFSLTQNLFAGFRTSEGLKVAEFQKDIAELTREERDDHDHGNQ